MKNSQRNNSPILSDVDDKNVLVCCDVYIKFFVEVFLIIFQILIRRTGHIGVPCLILFANCLQ